MGKWKYLRYVVAVILIGVALYKFYPHIHEASKLSKLKDANFFWIFMAALTQVLQYSSDGWLSKILLKLINFRISFKDTLRIASLDIFASHLLPLGRVGSLTAVYYFYSRLGVEPEAIVFQVASWGVITTSVLLSIFFLSFLLLPQDFAYFPESIRTLITLFFVVILLLLLTYLLTKKRQVRHFLQRKLNVFSWSTPFFAFLKKWQTYKRLAISHPMLILEAVIAATFYYVADIATLGFSFLAFGVTPPIQLLTFAYTASLVAGLITFAPAGLGATDATLALVFLSTKIDPVYSIGAILIFRLITFWLPIPAGAISYFTLKKKVRRS